MKRLIQTIMSLHEKEFSGYIRINFTQGSIGRVEKVEELEDAAISAYGEGKKKKEAGQAQNSKAVQLTKELQK